MFKFLLFNLRDKKQIKEVMFFLGMEVFSGYFQPKNTWKTVIGTTGEKLLVAKPLNEESLRKGLQRIKDKGIESIAVVLMHSYT